ncbi:MAG: hypothetical protein IJY89_07010, partial [Clostridia bacterium]|nr:hypothetical protein [Clostridia bacterium]
MIREKVISSLEKVRLINRLEDFKEVKVLKAARGERVSFQVVAQDPPSAQEPRAMGLHLAMRSKLSKYIKGFYVGQVPMALPVYAERCSGDYITKEPGLIPDVLYPWKKQKYYTQPYSLVNFWYTVELPEDAEPGNYPVCITLKGVKDGVDAKVRVVIQVLDTVIPK